MVECIKENNGNIRSFDGDRVLAVFVGKSKVYNAINCAMKMVGCRYDVLQPKINTVFKNDKFSLGVGISTGNTMVSKAGVGYDKNNRDLIWLGDPPNLGSKLSDKADSPYSIYICKETFGRLTEGNRYTTKNGIKTDMWTKDFFKFKTQNIDIYKTGYYRSL
jgi:class 3 adenylate cyclase